jgi:hypothetical protein
MRYAFVEDGIVKQSNRPLPNVWANVSNFDLFDISTLKNYGWYPYRFVEAQKDVYDIVDGSYFSIEEDEVVEYQTTRKKTDEDLQNEIINQWGNVRARRNIELMESDWTQRIYRQQLRDITLQTDPFNITWPNKPQPGETIIEEVVSDVEPEPGITNE